MKSMSVVCGKAGSGELLIGSVQGLGEIGSVLSSILTGATAAGAVAHLTVSAQHHGVATVAAAAIDVSRGAAHSAVGVAVAVALGNTWLLEGVVLSVIVASLHF